MATTSLGIISSRGLQPFVRGSSSFRNRGPQRGFLLAPGKSFRAFRTIKKASPRKSPRVLTRSFSRFGSVAMADSRVRCAIAEEQEDDVTRSLDDSNRIVDGANAVLADVVDGQKFIKETGRTKPRPMKRRALVVCLALSALRRPIDDVVGTSSNLGRSASTSRLARVPSSGFARTAHLVSQLSFGAPKSPGVHVGEN